VLPPTVLPPTLHLPDDVVGTLHEGRQAYVAVAATSGPHVTPELYAWSGGRLWFASATTTLKTTVLRREPHGAAVVSAGGRSVLVRGHIDAFDARHPLELARRAPAFAAASIAWADYVLRNAPDLVAFALDALSGRLGRRIPPLRVLHALTPASVAVVEGGDVTDRWGHWKGRPATARRRTGRQGGGTAMTPGGRPAVAAVPGPLALPGRWDDADDTFRMAPALAALVGLPRRFPMSVVVDEYVSPGPAAKEGTLLRGEARLVPAAPGTIALDPERAVEWRGVDTVTHHA
jgi:hypothetical protein